LSAGTVAAAVLAASGSALLVAQEGRLGEHHETSRILLDIRVLDHRGDPLPGLRTSDLRVSVDGQRANLESVGWVSATAPRAEGLDPEGAASTGEPASPAGRRVVLFLQKGLAEASQLKGLMRMKRDAVKLVDGLAAEDRVALLSFDTRLKLWLDFTSDRKRVKAVLQYLLLVDSDPAKHGPASPVSLAAQFDYGAAVDAATPEASLLVIARALESVPGAKSLAFFAWGIGRLEGDTIHMAPEYEAARRALSTARAAVFSLDVSDVDSHALEPGLQNLSEETGGLYVKTLLFPALSLSWLERALAGHYTISFERPNLGKGIHTVKVGLTRLRGTVLTSGAYVD